MRFNLCVVLCALFLTLGCDSASNPVAPSGSVLTLSASPSVIALDGEFSTLTVTGFRPDGNPLNPGTQILVTTDLGVLRASPSESSPSISLIEADSSGRAVFYLFGDRRTGPAMVSASLSTIGGGGGGADGGGGGVTGVTSTTTVQIGQSAEDRPTITVDANPTSIQVGGSSTITVTARQADGTPLVGGAVTLRTNLGQLSPSSGIVTDSSGVARATLTSNQSGQATITATVDSSDEATATVDIGTTRKPSLLINANPSTIDVLEFSTVTVTARDENGNTLGAGQEILLTADLGVLRSGPSDSAAMVDRIRTGSDGRAVVYYHAGGTAGQGNVTAILGNSDPASVSITVRAAPASITFVASKNTVDRNGDSLTLIATVFDGEGQPIGGEVVRFSLSGGVSGTFVPAGGTDTTDNNGEAQVTVTFDNNDIPDTVDQFQVFAAVGNIDADPVTINVQ